MVFRFGFGRVDKDGLIFFVHQAPLGGSLSFGDKHALILGDILAGDPVFYITHVVGGITPLVLCPGVILFGRPLGLFCIFVAEDPHRLHVDGAHSPHEGFLQVFLHQMFVVFIILVLAGGFGQSFP